MVREGWEGMARNGMGDIVELVHEQFIRNRCVAFLTGSSALKGLGPTRCKSHIICAYLPTVLELVDEYRCLNHFCSLLLFRSGPACLCSLEVWDYSYVMR